MLPLPDGVAPIVTGAIHRLILLLILFKTIFTKAPMPEAATHSCS